MLELASDHGIRYTGVMIENYGDATDGTIEKQKDTKRFEYFGNMLLHQGGGAWISWIQSSAVKPPKYGLWRCASI